jgi:predicted nuclease of restriction endonuclease-like (RecB) superfamily
MVELSSRLSDEFGKGYGKTNLFLMRLFFMRYPIFHALRGKFLTTTESDGCSDSATLRSELSWTHYRLLLRVEKTESRAWYMNEAADQNWSTRALERQIGSLYYERLLMSRGKRGAVEKEAREKTAELAASPEDFIKDPYVLEFLGIPDPHAFRESELEQAIIGKLQSFLLELGKGFAFVARQQRISTETKDCFIDLVFYNYLLKCFVLIDLKAGALTHQDIGQMDMYVRLYEDQRKNPGDNPTIGLILCTDKDETVVKYSVLNESSQIFASQYRLVLPTEEELRREIERERDLVIREQMERYGEWISN